jgi:hypothetical protein
MKLSIWSAIFTPYSFANSQTLLIKPFDRLRFVLVFITVTILSSIAASFISTQPAFDLLWERSQIQYGIVTGIISGVLLGASQWLVIRKYISDWKWILVSCFVATVAITIRTSIDLRVQSAIASGAALSGQEQWVILTVIISLITAIGTFLMSGYLQWYVIRRYVTDARWWIFMPSIVAAILAVVGLVRYLTHNLFSFDQNIVNMTILPATQAIGFCLLKRKIVSEQPISQSSLALAPDLVNYWNIRKLEKQLRSQIDRIWMTDLETTKKLSYLVGSNQTGEIVAYEPLEREARHQGGRDSADLVQQTPLPQLAENTHALNYQAEDFTSFAKFHITFTPPGIVQIYSLRGVPFVWLGIAIYSIIILISILPMIYMMMMM